MPFIRIKCLVLVLALLTAYGQTEKLLKISADYPHQGFEASDQTVEGPQHEDFKTIFGENWEQENKPVIQDEWNTYLNKIFGLSEVKATTENGLKLNHNMTFGFEPTGPDVNKTTNHIDPSNKAKSSDKNTSGIQISNLTKTVNNDFNSSDPSIQPVWPNYIQSGTTTTSIPIVTTTDLPERPSFWLGSQTVTVTNPNFSKMYENSPTKPNYWPSIRDVIQTDINTPSPNFSKSRQVSNSKPELSFESQGAVDPTKPSYWPSDGNLHQSSITTTSNQNLMPDDQSFLFNGNIEVNPVIQTNQDNDQSSITTTTETTFTVSPTEPDLWCGGEGGIDSEIPEYWPWHHNSLQGNIATTSSRFTPDDVNITKPSFLFSGKRKFIPSNPRLWSFSQDKVQSSKKFTPKISPGFMFNSQSGFNPAIPSLWSNQGPVYPTEPSVWYNNQNNGNPAEPSYWHSYQNDFTTTSTVIPSFATGHQSEISPNINGFWHSIYDAAKPVHPINWHSYFKAVTTPRSSDSAPANQSPSFWPGSQEFNPPSPNKANVIPGHEQDSLPNWPGSYQHHHHHHNHHLHNFNKPGHRAPWRNGYHYKYLNDNHQHFVPNYHNQLSWAAGHTYHHHHGLGHPWRFHNMEHRHDFD